MGSIILEIFSSVSRNFMSVWILNVEKLLKFFVIKTSNERRIYNKFGIPPFPLSYHLKFIDFSKHKSGIFQYQTPAVGSLKARIFMFFHNLCRHEIHIKFKQFRLILVTLHVSCFLPFIVKFNERINEIFASIYIISRFLAFSFRLCLRIFIFPGWLSNVQKEWDRKLKENYSRFLCLSIDQQEKSWSLLPWKLFLENVVRKFK